MILAIVALQVLSNVGALFVVLRYLARRDAGERIEREALTRRVQSPELAGAADAMTVVGPATDHSLPYDDDGAWYAYVNAKEGVNVDR